MPYQHTSRAEHDARRATIADALDSPDAEFFTISPRDGNGKRDRDNGFDVLAETVEQAAERAAHVLYGNDVTARRTTGDYGKSGYFQAYQWLAKCNAWASVGASFHVG